MALPEAFSKEALPAQAVPEGSGKWWGRLLMKNTGDKKESHPNRCVLGCGMLWTKSGCNATKQAGHIIGDDKSIKMCSKATEDDKRLAASFRTKPPSSQRLTMRLTVTRELTLTSCGVFYLLRNLQLIAGIKKTEIWRVGTVS